MKSFILMIQFLTRIPIPIELDVTKEDFQKGPVYFPVIGMIIGCILYTLYHISNGHISPLLLALIIVVAEVLITGGLHLDGLSDTFDGIYSNRDKERMLEIMKDSRLGANGALALFFFMLLKIALIMELNPEWAMLVIITMPVIGRFNILVACRFSKYAREDGMGNFFIGKVSNFKLFLGFMMTLAFVVGVGNYELELLILLVGSLGFVSYYIQHVKKKIDGMTGDTLGALCELTEIVVLGIAVLLQTL